MPGNKRFIESAPTRAWLSQFDPDAQCVMSKMLKAMRLVTRDQFADSLRARLLQAAEGTSGLIGLYVEREMPPKSAPAAPLFSQSQESPRRAIGPGPRPIVFVRRTHVDAQSTRRIHLAAGTQRCGSNSPI